MSSSYARWPICVSCFSNVRRARHAAYSITHVCQRRQPYTGCRLAGAGRCDTAELHHKSQFERCVLAFCRPANRARASCSAGTCVCVCVCLSFWARRLRDARSSGAGAGRGNAEQQGQESQLEKFVEYRTHAPALERTERFRFLCGNSLTDHALRCRAMRCYNCPCSQTTKSATWGHWRWLRLCRVAGSPFLTCGVRARDCEKQCRLNGC